MLISLASFRIPRCLLSVVITLVLVATLDVFFTQRQSDPLQMWVTLPFFCSKSLWLFFLLLLSHLKWFLESGVPCGLLCVPIPSLNTSTVLSPPSCSICLAHIVLHDIPQTCQGHCILPIAGATNYYKHSRTINKIWLYFSSLGVKSDISLS